MSSWIVVTDFDGTLSEKDVGDELSAEALGDAFRALLARYRSGELDLKTYQLQVWTKFPMIEKTFRARAVHHGRLKAGVTEFLALCAQKNVPVYIASCGLRAYIEPVLEKFVGPEARKIIHEIKCNEATFDEHGIKDFMPPASGDDGPYPLDKGVWVKELRERHPGAKILGVGNGTSDRTFWPNVDTLAATSSLARWCDQEKIPYVKFNDFRDLLKLPLFN